MQQESNDNQIAHETHSMYVDDGKSLEKENKLDTEVRIFLNKAKK